MQQEGALLRDRQAFQAMRQFLTCCAPEGLIFRCRGWCGPLGPCRAFRLEGFPVLVAIECICRHFPAETPQAVHCTVVGDGEEPGSELRALLRPLGARLDDAHPRVLEDFVALRGSGFAEQAADEAVERLLVTLVQAVESARVASRESPHQAVVAVGEPAVDGFRQETLKHGVLDALQCATGLYARVSETGLRLARRNFLSRLRLRLNPAGWVSAYQQGSVQPSETPTMHNPIRKMTPLPATRRPKSLWRRWTFGATLGVLLPLAVLIPVVAPAHDWPSPPPGGERRLLPREPQVQKPWSGLKWRGPSAGEPSAPSARDCRRAPEGFELDGPGGPRPNGAYRHSRERSSMDDFAVMSVAPGSAHAAMAEAAKAPMSPSAEPGADHSRVMRMRSHELAPSPAQQTPVGRPADEPVSVGMVDDNADFGEFLAYRKRSVHLTTRALAVEDRVRLEVRDLNGRPVPDAQVKVLAGGRAQPLWARTDASGRAWLMPQADMTAKTLEVLVSKGDASTPRGLAKGPERRLAGAAERGGTRTRATGHRLPDRCDGFHGGRDRQAQAVDARGRRPSGAAAEHA